MAATTRQPQGSMLHNGRRRGGVSTATAGISFGGRSWRSPGSGHKSGAWSVRLLLRDWRVRLWLGTQVVDRLGVLTSNFLTKTAPVAPMLMFIQIRALSAGFEAKFRTTQSQGAGAEMASACPKPERRKDRCCAVSTVPIRVDTKGEHFGPKKHALRCSRSVPDRGPRQSSQSGQSFAHVGPTPIPDRAGIEPNRIEVTR